MSLLRYGIIGAGMMGREHIRNIQLLDNIEITSICEPDATQQIENRKLCPDAFLTNELDSFLTRDDIDVIVICTPNDTHIDVIREIFKHEPRAILLEKPVVTRFEDIAELNDLAKDWPSPIWVGMEYRFMPPVAKFIDGINQGQAGSVKMLTIRENRFPFLEKVGDWNRFNERTGGTLVEKCCHYFDLMRFSLSDEPIRVYASGAADVNHLDEAYDGKQPDIIDNGYVIVDFASGCRAMLELCMFAEGAWFQEEIFAMGDKGRLSCHVPGPARFWPNAEERDSYFENAPRSPKGPIRNIVEVDHTILQAGDHHGATYFAHQGLQNAVLNGAPVQVTLEDGLKAVAIGLAAEQSVKTNQPVDLQAFFKGCFS